MTLLDDLQKTHGHLIKLRDKINDYKNLSAAEYQTKINDPWLKSDGKNIEDADFGIQVQGLTSKLGTFSKSLQRIDSEKEYLLSKVIPTLKKDVELFKTVSLNEKKNCDEIISELNAIEASLKSSEVKEKPAHESKLR